MDSIFSELDYSNYILTTEGDINMRHEITMPPLPSMLVGLGSSTAMWNPAESSSFPAAYFGNGGHEMNTVSIFEAPAVLPDHHHHHQFDDDMHMASLCSSIPFAGIQSFHHQEPAYDEFAHVKCNDQYFVSDLEPIYADADADAWGNQVRSLPRIEEPSTKVRRYSVEERKDRILKYLKKRNQRNFNKTIKYACRKSLADRRIRIRGRFARNNEQVNEDFKTAKMNNNINIDHHHEEEEYYNINDDGHHEVKDINSDEWLQEAMTSLMYLPIFAG